MPNLMLVMPGPYFRPPPPIGERPELAVAFERGQRDRAAARTSVDWPPEEFTEFVQADPQVRVAYRLGLGGEVWAPAPLPVAFALPVASIVMDALEHRWSPRRGWAVYVAAGAGSLLVMYGTSRLERRRAEVLGLTAATAPVPAGGLAVGLQSLIAVGHQAWVRARTGTWPLTSPSSLRVAAVLREFNRRRSWNAALAYAPGTGAEEAPAAQGVWEEKD